MSTVEHMNADDGPVGMGILCTCGKRAISRRTTDTPTGTLTRWRCDACGKEGEHVRDDETPIKRCQEVVEHIPAAKDMQWEKEVKPLEFTLKNLEGSRVQPLNYPDFLMPWKDMPTTILTHCKPEFPPEAYSIENLLALSTKMKEERRKVDEEMKKSLKAYFKGCGLKELMEFCQHMRADGNSIMNHINSDEPIPGWFYDRLKTWVESKKEKPQ